MDHTLKLWTKKSVQKQPEKENKQQKKPSFPKMLWFFATVTRKQVLYFITYCFDPICGPTVRVKLLSAITNWPTCQIQKLVLPTRLIVLFTPSKVCNPAPLHAGFLPSSILTYFSVFWIFRVLLCLLYFYSASSQAGHCLAHLQSLILGKLRLMIQGNPGTRNKTKPPWHACFLPKYYS